MTGVRCILLPLLAAALIAPAPAAASVTIGSSLPASTGEPLECTDPGGCTFVPVSIAGTAVRVPYDGVIVRWAARLPAGATSPISLRVLRSASGGQFTASGSHSATPGPDAERYAEGHARYRELYPALVPHFHGG